MGRDGLRRGARGKGVGLGKGKGQRRERAWEGRGPRSGNQDGKDGRSGKGAGGNIMGIQRDPLFEGAHFHSLFLFTYFIYIL